MRTFCFAVVMLLGVQASAREIKVLSFNVLAPCWASRSRYPEEASPFLAPVERHARIAEVLRTLARDADVIALQETTRPLLTAVSAALGEQFLSFASYHAPNHWREWITPDVAWEPNGVALFVRRAVFTHVEFTNVPLSDNGNHAAVMRATHIGGEALHAASVHLDGGEEPIRQAQLLALFDLLGRDKAAIDVIAGDFNIGTRTGSMHEDLQAHGFVDALRAVGAEEWTCPYYSTEGYDREDFGILDHVVVRGADPIAGVVRDFGLWETFPYNENGRIAACLKMGGSDHFPIEAVLHTPG